ncbi:DMT family transporter [Formosa algae]|uniref:Drug/metabolite transporter (DMT)-like permease n=2 Tax=Formosa algae TaxID=225843 RepID=A0A9X0YKS4_9FLAO|nr:DMT family transporter [Formosa algae]MBP1840370.1 drug/metabolite transporter (DMT)-like permease [Formosa algae]MDQ0334234.1 drug/metabolite transporter (DMT)-like permease [Formosa algae]OEI82226.1 multidrug transporter [Formosa algae]
MNKRILALIALFLVQLFYGLNYSFANDVIDGGYIKPFGFILLRLLGATTLFWIVGLFTPKQKIDKEDYLTFIIAAFFGMCLNMLSFFKGLEFTTPIHASVISTITPIVVIVLSSIYLKERITPLKILGIILGFTGAVILSAYGKPIHPADNIILGNCLIILNATAFSVYLIIAKRLTGKYHPLTIIKWLFLLGLIMTTPFGLQEFNAVQWHTFSPYIAFSAFFVVVFATFGAYLLNILGLTQLKASTAGTFVYIQPVIAAIFALIIGSDTINIVKIITAILIFMGVYLVTKKTE